MSGPNPALFDAYEMTTVTFNDGSSITGRVSPTPHGGYTIQHVVARAHAITLFVEYEDMT